MFRRNPIPNGVQTELKREENIFGIFVKYGKKNQREKVPEGATRQGGVPAPLGAPLTLMGPQ